MQGFVVHISWWKRKDSNPLTLSPKNPNICASHSLSYLNRHNHSKKMRILSSNILFLSLARAFESWELGSWKGRQGDTILGQFQVPFHGCAKKLLGENRARRSKFEALNLWGLDPSILNNIINTNSGTKVAASLVHNETVSHSAVTQNHKRAGPCEWNWQSCSMAREKRLQAFGEGVVKEGTMEEVRHGSIPLTQSKWYI